jgi:CARDB/Dockerin type I domain/Cohesin domain
MQIRGRRDAMKRTQLLFYTFLILSILTLPIYRVSAVTTTVAVDPATTNATGGNTFNINITVNNIVNFTSWQLTLYYLRAIVNCSNAVEGPFLKTGGGTYFNANITNNYNSTYGRVLAYSTLLGMTAVNGGGTILTLTFKAMSGGTTNLTLADTKLGDEKIPPQPIPHQDINGVVNVTGGAHDVAITDVTPYKTIIGQGYTGNISFTTENHGGFAETYNVTLYANTTVIAVIPITALGSGGSITQTAVLDATGFAYGNYTLTAVADTVPGEINPTDNTYSSPIQVHIGVPGDVSGPTIGVYDKICNMRDISYMIILFNTKPSSPNWKPNADVNNDGTVNMRDITIAILHFSQHE